MKKTLKHIRIVAVVFAVIITIASIITQYEAEKYLSKQKEKYNILLNKKRVSYCPIIFFYFTHEVLGMHEVLNNRKVTSSLYNLNLDFKNMNDTIYNSYSSNISYDKYFAYVYYSSNEIDSIINDTILEYSF